MSVIGSEILDVGKIGQNLLIEAAYGTPAPISEEMQDLIFGGFACPSGEIAARLVMGELAPENKTGVLI